MLSWIYCLLSKAGVGKVSDDGPLRKMAVLTRLPQLLKQTCERCWQGTKKQHLDQNQEGRLLTTRRPPW